MSLLYDILLEILLFPVVLIGFCVVMYGLGQVLSLMDRFVRLDRVGKVVALFLSICVALCVLFILGKGVSELWKLI